MPNPTPRALMHAAADQASAAAAGFLDTTSLAYECRRNADGAPAGTMYAAQPATRKNIFTTHLVSLHTAEARVTKPEGFTSPFTRRRGPRAPLPLARSAATAGAGAPADAYTVEYLVATFNDPLLAPFNVYIRSRAAEYIQERNDAVYRDWFVENRIPVVVPRTYAACPPMTRLVTAANSAVLGQWSVPVHDKDELEAYVAGRRGDLVTGDEPTDEEEGGMLVADLVAFGDSRPHLHKLAE
jgi:hypothetical protein